jgi:hypothetical protein
VCVHMFSACSHTMQGSKGQMQEVCCMLALPAQRAFRLAELCRMHCSCPPKPVAAV